MQPLLTKNGDVYLDRLLGWGFLLLCFGFFLKQINLGSTLRIKATPDFAC